MTTVVILAGGLGTRMHSDLPKVLHFLGGQPLIETVLQTVSQIDPGQILVVGSPFLFKHSTWKEVRARAESLSSIQEVIQESPLGTGHAVQTALPFIKGERTLVLHADVPLVQPETLKALEADEADVTLGVVRDLYAAYGKVALDREGHPTGIVESTECRESKSINAGLYGVSTKCLQSCLASFQPHITKNQTSELYFTDIVFEACKRGLSVSTLEVAPEEAYGINTPQELLEAPLQTFLRRRQKNVAFQGSVVLSMDTKIGAGTTIGAFCVFGPRVVIGRGATILSFCVLEDCRIEDGATVGPFAHLKMGACVGEQAVVGNFVEVKKTTIGARTKAKHLSYLGDARIGEEVNIGAGAVICNYDGFQKHKTTIENGAKIGANASLVAPVVIRREAFVGAGSVITKDVPAETLAVARAPQVHNEAWLQRKKKSGQGIAFIV